MHWVWTILVGFAAGFLAKLITPGKKEPSGFILTSLLGIAGSIAASFLGQTLGLYPAGSGAGFIASVLGAALLLLVYNFVSRKS
ncbi:MAG: GlsB/YeaQ/YmgE family stress response membrane protein [Brachymonas sp.]|nr:GlsB/YeaQ/YmgE family stress response membrane protein [Brachymonas sp.]